jgi:hypothetical protein
MRIRRTVLMICSIFAFAGSLAATPLVWTLSGVTFNDGGLASGSFVYDAVTNTYSSINVTTTNGSVRTGATYHFIDAGVSSGALVLAVVTTTGDLTGTPALAFPFTPALSDAGGTVSVLGAIEVTCGNASCSTATAPVRSASAGSVSSSSLPTPTPVPALSTLGAAVLAILIGASGLASLRKLSC